MDSSGDLGGWMDGWRSIMERTMGFDFYDDEAGGFRFPKVQGIGRKGKS